MLAMTKPSYFMPIHGEAVHLRAHAELAKQMGIADDHIFIADNGDALEMRGGKVAWGEPVESGVVYVDGLSVTDADPVVFRDRQRLASGGLVTCVVTISARRKRQTIGEVVISGKGISFSEDEELLLGAQEYVREHVGNAAVLEGASVESLQKTTRNCLSNYLWNKTHTRPMVIPVVMEV